MRLSSTPAVGLDNYPATAHPTAAPFYDPIAENAARLLRVLRTVKSWRRPYPEGLGETCCICLEESKSISTSPEGILITDSACPGHSPVWSQWKR
jgi:hypothetical protein